MPSSFTRRTIVAASGVLSDYTQNESDRFLLEHGLENLGGAGAVLAKANRLARYLLEHPEDLDEDGRNLTDRVIEALVNNAIWRCTHYGDFRQDDFERRYSDLKRGLERDAFTVEGGQLRRALPPEIDLPRADNEVHTLLNDLGFNVPLGHLEQGIAAHARADWAAANGQFRPFIESLCDEIAERLGRGGVLPQAGNDRRQWLAQINPPFFIRDLNEWTGQGTGFLEGFYRRLHPQGAHPGLSDEDDSTFRLHLVLLVARLLLRRLRARLQ